MATQQPYQATPEQLEALCRAYDWWARMQPIIEQRKRARKVKEAEELRQ